MDLEEEMESLGPMSLDTYWTLRGRDIEFKSF
jgi:hypothetical protein